MLSLIHIQALAQAGDLTIYGKRDNVLLIRQDAAGEKHTYRMNLNDANIINSCLLYTSPELKASENFKALQVQEEGTENRISEARRKYNEAVQNYRGV